jgi:hypothetical protein
MRYLREAGLVIDGVKFWGSRWIPPYAGSFNPPENELQQKWGPHSFEYRCARHSPAARRRAGRRNGMPDSLLWTCSRISRSNFRRHHFFQLRGCAFNFSCMRNTPIKTDRFQVCLPNIFSSFCFSMTSAGERPWRPSHETKSFILTSCFTGGCWTMPGGASLR